MKQVALRGNMSHTYAAQLNITTNSTDTLVFDDIMNLNPYYSVMKISLRDNSSCTMAELIRLYKVKFYISDSRTGERTEGIIYHLSNRKDTDNREILEEGYDGGDEIYVHFEINKSITPYPYYFIQTTAADSWGTLYDMDDISLLYIDWTILYIDRDSIKEIEIVKTYHAGTSPYSSSEKIALSTATLYEGRYLCLSGSSSNPFTNAGTVNHIGQPVWKCCWGLSIGYQGDSRSADITLPFLDEIEPVLCSSQGTLNSGDVISIGHFYYATEKYNDYNFVAQTLKSGTKQKSVTNVPSSEYPRMSRPCYIIFDEADESLLATEEMRMTVRIKESSKYSTWKELFTAYYGTYSQVVRMVFDNFLGDEKEEAVYEINRTMRFKEMQNNAQYGEDIFLGSYDYFIDDDGSQTTVSQYIQDNNLKIDKVEYNYYLPLLQKSY